jgi:hypothetical protein
VEAVKVPEVQNLRRSERVSQEMPILLVGCDAQGKTFMEDTKTVVLSRHGAQIVSTRKLAVDQELAIVRKDINRETAIRVVGQMGGEEKSHTYGVAFVDPYVDFWGVEFAVPCEASMSNGSNTLACVLCGSRELTDFDTLESDICATQGSILRYCQRCGSSTKWKLSAGEIPDKAAQAVPLVTEPPVEAPFKNRRRHVRAKVNFAAFVRVQGREDMASCENVSRGGLCFRSRQRYSKKTNIEIAAPYFSGSPFIPVPAQIVYVQEVPEDKTFRYGVQYLPKEPSPRAAACGA